MIAAALIILLLALLFTIAILAGAGESMTVELFGSEVSTAGNGLFLAGVVIGAGAALALWFLRIGMKKGWRQHRRMKELERRAEQAEVHEPVPTTETSSATSTEATSPEAAANDKT